MNPWKIRLVYPYWRRSPGSLVLSFGFLSLLFLSSCQESPSGVNPAVSPSIAQSSSPIAASIAPSAVPSSAQSAAPSSTQHSTQSPGASATPQLAGTNTTTVQIYAIDDTCEKLVPKPMSFPDDRSLEASIEKILSLSAPSDLSPMTYHLDLDRQTGAAILDLKPTPAAHHGRSIESLSSCEQLALLGSLRETLVHHAAWGIDRVEFKENGKSVLL